MIRPSRLRTRFLRLSAIATSLTVVVFMAGTLIHLRYGMEQTIDQQLETLGPDILAQINRQDTRLEPEELPIFLTLFDENNMIRLLRLETISGAPLYSNRQYDELLEEDQVKRARDLAVGRDADALQTRWFEGRSWRIAEYEDRRHRLILAADLAQLDQSLWQVLIAFVFALPIAVAGAAIASVILAKQASDPIERLTARARTITASRLDARLDLGPAPLEVKALGEIFDRMMDRLQRSFEQARRFSADASHELKSPLTVMQGVLENRLSEDADAGISRDEAVQLLEETLRMRAIVEGLLVLAKADEGSLLRKREAVDIGNMLEELAEDSAVMAEARGVHFHRDSRTLPPIQGDALLLRLALHNLLSNAVKYCPTGGRVQLRTMHERAQLIFEVSNSCIPLPEEIRDRIFDRFFRLDHTRSRSGSGIGLGLNIAREIARAHGGEITLEPKSEDEATFRMVLPLRIEAGEDLIKSVRKRA